MCVWGVRTCIVACAHLGNSTDKRTATLPVPLLLTSGPVRYEVVKPNGGRYQFVTMHTHGDFIGLPHCDFRLLAP